MAANSINVVGRLHAVQYTGSNSADIIAMDPGFTYNNSSESAGVWSFQSPPDSTSFTIDSTDWILFAQNQVFSKATNTEFPQLYSCNTLCADLDPILTRTGVRAIGVAPVPTLLLSGTANVDVTIRPSMPNTSFTAYAAKFAGVSLTDLQINSVTVVNVSTVRVAVQNVGLVTLAGANVLVHAVA